MRSSGLSHLAMQDACTGEPFPHTFVPAGIPTSMLDYVWVEGGHRVGSSAPRGVARVVRDVGSTSDHALIEGCIEVPGELLSSSAGGDRELLVRPLRVKLDTYTARGVNDDVARGLTLMERVEAQISSGADCATVATSFEQELARIISEVQPATEFETASTTRPLKPN